MPRYISFWLDLLRFRLLGLFAAFATAFAIMMPWHYWQVWQVKNLRHAEATILDLWDVEYKSKRRTSLHVWGKIKYQVETNNQAITCTSDVRLGLPEDNLIVGNKIDVVPRGENCDAPPLVPNIVLLDRGIS